MIFGGAGPITPPGGYVTPMTGAGDANTITNIGALAQNNSLVPGSLVVIQITRIQPTAAELADPVFMANSNNLATARAQTLMTSLIVAGVPAALITIAPTLGGATPSATITYQRRLASTDPTALAPNPVGSGVPAPPPASR